MGVIINQGWLTVADDSTPTNSMKVYFERATVDFIFEPIIKHYPSNAHYGYNPSKEWLVFNIRNIILTSHSNFSSFVDYIKDWNNASSIYIRLQYDTTPNYIEWDGDSTFFEVLLLRLTGMHQVSSSKELFIIERAIFEQVG